MIYIFFLNISQKVFDRLLFCQYSITRWQLAHYGLNLGVKDVQKVENSTFFQKKIDLHRFRHPSRCDIAILATLRSLCSNLILRKSSVCVLGAKVRNLSRQRCEIFKMDGL